MRSTIFCLLLVPLLACASPIAPIGKDTYVLSGDMDASAAESMKEASDFCTRRGKLVRVREMGYGGAQVVFLCLDESDPEYQARPQRPDRQKIEVHEHKYEHKE